MSVNQPINNRKDYEKFYSKELKQFISDAERKAYDFPLSEITPEFFVLCGLENKNCLLYKTLNTFIDSSNINLIYDEISNSIEQYINVLSGKKITLSSATINYIKKANNERKLLEHDLITSDHVLLSILSEENTISNIFSNYMMTYSLFMSLLKDMHTLTDEINDESVINDNNPKVITLLGGDVIGDFGENLDIIGKIQESLNNVIGGQTKKEEKKGNLEFCTDLNKLAETGNIDNICGRDDEINKIIEILNRRKSNNVILVGDPGVGKTAIIEGLALKIVKEEVPVVMLNKKIWKLNIGSMVAGTQFRGMFEERMEKMIKNLKSSSNNILFIDDIQSTMHSGGKNSDYDIMGSLNEILNDGTVQVIATTNHKGYRSIFETNNSFTSKFQKITIDKPSKERCFNILKHISPQYEKHHNVKYSDEILNLCINLAERYTSDRTLPTSAIDLIDEVGSHCFIKNSFSVDIAELKAMKSEIKKEIKKYLKKDDMEKVSELEKEIEEIDNKTAKIGTNTWAIIEKGIEITPNDVYEVVSRNSGVPINKLTTEERNGLKNIENILREKVVGQDDAIETICRVIKRNKLGLSLKNKPIGSFLLVGKTGVGKTYLAKKIAEEVFGDEKYLVRFDMSEYSDKTSVNKLIGSSAGYIGYENGGLLTEAIKKQKYAVLLIDEIEKANEEIFNLFLQVLDEGFLTDNTGRKVDFKNTIIILTSNVGTKRASIDKSLGFIADEDEKYKSVLDKELKDKFPPEFLNRLDDIVYFNSLTDENLKKIISIELDSLVKRLKNKNYLLNYDNNIVEYIFNLVIREKEFGARPIIRTIQKEIENRVVDILLEDENTNNFNFTVQDNLVRVF